MIIRAKNWIEFQHYKDRAPPWIKLHKKLLDDRTYHALPDASKALAPMLWLLCSESEDGSINDAVAEIAFRLRMTERRVEDALRPLIDAGFFLVFDMEQSASGTLADCKQDARLEEERQRREETEESAGEILGETLDEVRECYAEFVFAAKERNWPTPRKLDDDRKRKLRARLREHGRDGWTAMLSEAKASDFLSNKWPLKFDWVLNPANFRKVIEGNYRNTTPEEPPRKVVGWN